MPNWYNFKDEWRRECRIILNSSENIKDDLKSALIMGLGCLDFKQRY